MNSILDETTGMQQAIMRADVTARYSDAAFSPLEMAAIDWLDGFYQLEHLLAARRWTIVLSCGNASEELKFAALVHDAERFFPGGPTSTPMAGFDDPDYLFSHSTRSADIVEAWLIEQGTIDGTFMRQVRNLILRHELGGNAQQDILQAADSLSFLETFDWLVADWVGRDIYSIDEARSKLDWMLTRIRPVDAITMALPHYRHAVAVVEGRTPLSEAEIAHYRQRATSKAVLLGPVSDSAKAGLFSVRS